MKAAIEDKQNNIGFYIFNGRYKNKFIKKVKREIKNLRSIWTYDVENEYLQIQKIFIKR